MVSPLLVTATLTSLSFMLIGFDNGVIGGLTGAPSFNRVLNYPTGKTLSTIVAIYEVGCFFGAVIAFSLGERLGRKRSITLGGIFMAIGAALQAGAVNVAMMIVARIVSGLGMGIINSTAPVLQAEVSPAASRGRYVCAQLSTLNFGIFLAYWLDFGMTQRYVGEVAFRFPLAFQLVIIIPIIILSFVVYESPRWLALHGRDQESLEVVAALLQVPVGDAEAQQRFKEIQDAVAYEKSVSAESWTQLFKQDKLQTRRRLLIACSVQFFQQLGGINGIIYYCNFVFSSSLGFSSYKASLMSGILFTWFFVASFIPWFLIDTLGRRQLLIGSVIAMTIIFAAMTGATHQIQHAASNAHSMGIFAAALSFLYLGSFTVGFQATVWVYPPEILPLQIRAKGTALATCCNWIINFAVVEIFPIAIDNIGWKTYIIFTVFNACFVPVMYLFYPETKGKTLEEIDLIFSPDHMMTIADAKQSVTADEKREFA
ncbi:general substrate transporter [Meredithblackwellia eburnea MCA 4105]